MKESCYKCDKCKDTGWILSKRENYNDLAELCECKKQEIVASQWRAAGINPQVSKETFSNFEVWNDSSRQVKEVAKSYFKHFNHIRFDRKNSILICGQVGSGKSHCSIALGLNFIKKNLKVVYMPYRDVITKVKQNMLDEEYYKKSISKYQTCEILLMDDLFKGKLTESDINIVFEIVNYRYLNRLPMIVSSEFLVEELLNFDEAIGSRIYEMCKDYIVEIEKDKGNNYRLR